MDNFKFNFLSRGQLESLCLNTFFLTVFRVLPCCEVFLVAFCAIIARMFSGNHLNHVAMLTHSEAGSA